MKITMGGNIGMTVTNIPYSPIKVESTLYVEKELDRELEGADLDLFVEEFNKKLEKIMYKDLENKMIVMADKQKKLKKKLENL